MQKYVKVIIPLNLKKAPPTSIFCCIFALFDPFRLLKPQNDKNLIEFTLFMHPFMLYSVILWYFGGHFVKRPLARVPHTSQRLAPKNRIQHPRIYKKTSFILLAYEMITGPEFWTLLKHSK